MEFAVLHAGRPDRLLDERVQGTLRTLLLEGGAVVPEKENKGDGMGQFGKLTSVDQLPPREVLAGYVRKALQLNAEGVPAPHVVKRRLQKTALQKTSLEKTRGAVARGKAPAKKSTGKKRPRRPPRRKSRRRRSQPPRSRARRSSSPRLLVFSSSRPLHPAPHHLHPRQDDHDRERRRPPPPSEPA